MEFLNSSNLEILNWGNEPTFCSSGSLEGIDIKVGALGLLENVIGWEGSLEPCLSDYRNILFTVQGSLLVRLVRNTKANNWSSYKGDMRDRLQWGPEMDMKNEAGLGLAINPVQHALISAYEDNCPLRPVKTGRQSLKWTAELQFFRIELRRLFNKCRSNKNPYSWELYRGTQRHYRKEVQKASKNACRTFCSSINDLPRSGRLHSVLFRDSKVKLGSLVAPSGRRRQS